MQSDVEATALKAAAALSSRRPRMTIPVGQAVEAARAAAADEFRGRGLLTPASDAPLAHGEVGPGTSRSNAVVKPASRRARRSPLQTSRRGTP